MASKTYKNHRPGSIAWNHLVDGILKQETLPFVGDTLVTDDVELQKYVESLPAFKQDWITLANDARADLWQKAVEAGESAKAAESQAVAAERAYADFVAKPKLLRDAAEAAKKAAADAVAAVSDYDKAHAAVPA